MKLRPHWVVMLVVLAGALAPVPALGQRPAPEPTVVAGRVTDAAARAVYSTQEVDCEYREHCPTQVDCASHARRRTVVRRLAGAGCLVREAVRE
jgi:hypothetical protein